MACLAPDLLFFPTPISHSCGKYCGKPNTTHEKSPSSEGLSYPKMLKPTIRIERTTCCLRNSCSTTEPRRQMRANITIIRWERQPLWLRNLKEFAAGRQ